MGDKLLTSPPTARETGESPAFSQAPITLPPTKPAATAGGQTHKGRNKKMLGRRSGTSCFRHAVVSALPP